MSAKIEFFRGFPRKPVRDLERERRLPDPGLSREEDETPWGQSPAEDVIELLAPQSHLLFGDGRYDES